jgi:hypothetical protein
MSLTRTVNLVTTLEIPSKIRTFLVDVESLYREPDHLSIIDIAPELQRLACKLLCKIMTTDCILISDNSMINLKNPTQ